MRPIKLSPGQARTAIESILEGISEIDRELERLETRVQMLEGEWNGGARDAFSQASREWNESVRALHSVARSAATIATGSVERIAEFDVRRAGAWGK